MRDSQPIPNAKSLSQNGPPSKVAKEATGAASFGTCAEALPERVNLTRQGLSCRARTHISFVPSTFMFFMSHHVRPGHFQESHSMLLAMVATIIPWSCDFHAVVTVAMPSSCHVQAKFRPLAYGHAMFKSGSCRHVHATCLPRCAMFLPMFVQFGIVHGMVMPCCWPSRAMLTWWLLQTSHLMILPLTHWLHTHHAITTCHHDMPSRHAITTCHQHTPSRRAIKTCHHNMPPRLAIKTCHQDLPPRHATLFHTMLTPHRVRRGKFTRQNQNDTGCKTPEGAHEGLHQLL